MLREHGTHRPSIFEILAHVHRLRGTKSRFTYTIPAPKPLSPGAPTANPLESLVSFRPSSGASPSRNAGVQAREKVLEAIAPMRRGRPSTSATHTPEPKSRPPSPQKEKTQGKLSNWLDDDFAAQEDKAWKAVQSNQAVPPVKHRSGIASMDAWKVRNPMPSAMDEAWIVEGRGKDAPREKPKLTPAGGFDNDFAENLWSSFEGASKGSSATGTKPMSISDRQPASSDTSNKLAVPRKSQDAFEGLGLSTSDRPPPQTLGEAKKLRTGLAVINGNAKSSISLSPSLQASRPSSTVAPRPTPSPRPSQFSGSSPGPAPSWKPSTVIPAAKPSYSVQAGDASAESRFPSVEELDATFYPPSVGSTAHHVHSTSQPQPANENSADRSLSALRPRMNSNVSGGLRPAGQGSYLKDGVRSAQVTGMAMRESKTTRAEGVQKHAVDELVDTGTTTQLKRSSRPGRPSLSRKHRSSIMIKHPQHSGNDVLTSPVLSSPAVTTSPQFSEPKDWLTGNDDAPIDAPAKSQSTSAETPVLREFTNKRASFIQSSSVELQLPQEAVTSEQLPSLPRSSSPTKPSFALPRGSQPSVDANDGPIDISGKLLENRSPVRVNAAQQNEKMSSSSDEGPEDVNGFTPPKAPKKKESKRRKGRQSSVHDLVDLWGGGVVHLKEKEKEIVRSPTVGDYKSYSPVTSMKPQDVKPLARRSTFLPTSSSSSPRATSPQSNSVPSSPQRPSRAGRPQRSSSNHRKQSSNVPRSSVAGSPSSSRTRPSSMFIFPIVNSKSDSSVTLPSPGLSPPEEPGRARRTSISDMVQRYEAIGGNIKTSGPTSPPIVAQKPTPLKVGTQTTPSGTNLRPTRTSQGSSPIISRGNARAGSTLPIPNDGPAHPPFHARPRTSPTGMNHTSSSGQRDSIWTREVENPSRATPRAKPLVTSDELISDGHNPQIPFPTRKFTTPPPEEESPQRSPSPEKPYQGVGKLIDQWQRKTADVEPEPKPGPRRSGFPVKRALPGLVGGGAGRGR